MKICEKIIFNGKDWFLTKLFTDFPEISFYLNLINNFRVSSCTFILNT